MTKIVNGGFFFVNGRWDVREIKRKTSKQKTEYLGVGVYRRFLFFTPQNCAPLFWFHAGNGSSVCQRLKLHRGSRNRERQAEIREGRGGVRRLR